MALIFKDRPCDHTKPNGYALEELIEIAKKLRINTLEPRKSKAVPATHRPMKKICEDIAAKLTADPSLEEQISHIVNKAPAPKKGKKVDVVPASAPAPAVSITYQMSDVLVLSKLLSLMIMYRTDKGGDTTVDDALNKTLGSVEFKKTTPYSVRIASMIKRGTPLSTGEKTPNIREAVYGVRLSGIYAVSDIALVIWENLTAAQKLAFAELRRTIYEDGTIPSSLLTTRKPATKYTQSYYAEKIFETFKVSADANKMLKSDYEMLWDSYMTDKFFVESGDIMTFKPLTAPIINNVIKKVSEELQPVTSHEYYNTGIGRLNLLLIKNIGKMPTKTLGGSARIMWFGQDASVLKPFNDSVLLSDVEVYGNSLLKSFKVSDTLDLTASTIHLAAPTANTYNFWNALPKSERKKWSEIRDPYTDDADALTRGDDTSAAPTLPEAIIKTLIVKLADATGIALSKDGSDDDAVVLAAIKPSIVSTAMTITSTGEDLSYAYDGRYNVEESLTKDLQVSVPEMGQTVILSGINNIIHAFGSDGSIIAYSMPHKLNSYFGAHPPIIYRELYRNRDKLPGVTVINKPRSRMDIPMRIFRATNRVVRKYIADNPDLFSDLEHKSKEMDNAAAVILRAFKKHGDFLTGLHLRHRAYIASLDNEIGCTETDFGDMCPSKHVLSASTTGRFMKYSGNEPIVWDTDPVVPNTLVTGVVKDKVISAIVKPPADHSTNIMSAATGGLTELPFSSALMEWNNIILNAPKTSKPVILYRGVSTTTPAVGDYIVHGVPFSTTMVSEMAESFPGGYGVSHGGCCLLVIKVPPGYPFLFLGARPSERLEELRRKSFKYSTDPLEFSKVNQFEVQMPATRFKVISIKDKVYEADSVKHFRRYVPYTREKRTIKQVFVEPELIYPVVVDGKIYVEPTLKRAIVRYNQYDPKKHYKLVEIPREITTPSGIKTRMVIMALGKISEPDSSYIRTIDVVPEGPLVEIIRELWEKNLLLVYNTDPYSWTTINHRAHSKFVSDEALDKYAKNIWFTGFNNAAYVSAIAKASEMLSK